MYGPFFGRLWYIVWYIFSPLLTPVRVATYVWTMYGPLSFPQVFHNFSTSFLYFLFALFAKLAYNRGIRLKKRGGADALQDIEPEG